MNSKRKSVRTARRLISGDISVIIVNEEEANILKEYKK